MEDQEILIAKIEKDNSGLNKKIEFLNEFENCKLENDDLKSDMKILFHEKLDQAKLFQNKIEKQNSQHDLLISKLEEYKCRMEEMQERIDKLII